MTSTKRRELIVSTWRQLGKPAVGQRVLLRIQQTIGEEFGEAVGESPVAIARVLADEGAELHHPEVIECDARWREPRIEARTKKFRNLEKLISNAPLDLKRTEALISKFEELRQRFERNDDQEALAVLLTSARHARRVAESIAVDRSADKTRRVEQSEIAEWLKVWIQTPSLCANWIDLRKRSDEFKSKFSEYQF